MIGGTISHYRIIEKLGEGGMGVVYRAEDLTLGRTVALKFLPPDSMATENDRIRLMHEARAAAALLHPNICPVYEIAESEGRMFIALAHIEGRSLKERIAEGPMPLDEALSIARQIGDALASAHAKGIIHRDIKPANIMLTADGRPMLMDFGLAKVSGTTKLTRTGTTMGTVGYMSPEQVQGREADHRSDIWALGAVLYEMVSGQPPFGGDYEAAILYSILNEDPAPLALEGGNIPVGFDGIVAQALAKDPARRYQKVEGLVADLMTLAHDPEALPAGRMKSASGLRRVWKRWHPWERVFAVSAACVLAGAIAVTAVVTWSQWSPFGKRSTSPPTAKDWILVAEFESPSADSTVAQAAQSLFSSALDQSKIVATVPKEQVIGALVAAGKPRNTRVDAQVAKELAYRSSVRTVLEGTIGRLGKGYSIVVNVRDAEDARLILTRSGTAKDDDALIPTIGEIAKELRKGLGEQQAALKATRSMSLVATPSFEAYRLYVQGQRVYSQQGANRAALRLYREALALDPDFAGAWLAAYSLYLNVGRADSAQLCLDEALRRPERLTTAQREIIERRRAYLDGDYARSLAALDRILAEDPENMWALGSSNDVLQRLGRYEQALERTRKSMRLSPFGPSEIHKVNETAGLIALGRYDEARVANERQSGIWKIGQRAAIEIAAGRFAMAESIAAANLDDPRVIDDNPAGLRWLLAMAQFGRGATGAAATTMKDMIERFHSANIQSSTVAVRLGLIEFSVISEGAMPLPPEAGLPDTSVVALLTQGLQEAVTQNQAVARRCLEVVRARPRRELVDNVFGPELLEARLENMAGRPEEAVRILRPIAGPRMGQLVSLTWVHWWLADAYEQMDRPDSAAVYLERVFSVAFGPDDGAEKPYVHRRLALLYARMGRLGDAERHLAAVEKAWDRPDPEVRRMLDEARAAVRGARGTTQPESNRP